MPEESKLLLLEPRDQFDAAFVGYVDRFGQDTIACYDHEKVIETFKSQGMSDDEAREFFSYNTIGAWAGEGTPCFLFKDEL
jgi:hypothetical protein